MTKAKEYSINKSYKGRDTVITGTLDYLNQYFSYALEVGYSYNRKIPTQPKTIRSLMSALEKATDERYGGCYERPFYTLM